ncbi:hypothetical protein MPER_12581 [Moniliophthora perniciosa FA553]|nr:hypothetical protein MPER_12581 [Moniliophthora perniciosa FA553]
MPKQADLRQTIDEAEYLLDQLPPPSSDDDEMVAKLRARLKDLLTNLRDGAEGTPSTGTPEARD